MDAFLDALFFFDGYDPYTRLAEKSAAANRREKDARTKFDAIRERFEHSLLNNKIRTAKLGASHSGSPLHILPNVVLDKIFDFIKPPAFDEYVYGAPVRVSKKKPVPLPPPPTLNDPVAATAVATAVVQEGDNDSTAIPLDINTLYKPGHKHVVPLLIPSEHLTGPCWRDFGHYVRKHPNWNLKRTKASDSERKVYKEFRKGSVYFVNVYYTVPPRGIAKTSTAAKKKKAPPPMAVEDDSKPLASKQAKTSSS